MKETAPKIVMTACKSSQISSHGYDAATCTLAVTFSSGGTYHYENVPATTYSEMLKAKSIGGHLHSSIKSKFKHKKIGA